MHFECLYNSADPDSAPQTVTVRRVFPDGPEEQRQAPLPSSAVFPFPSAGCLAMGEGTDETRASIRLIILLCYHDWGKLSSTVFPRKNFLEKQGKEWYSPNNRTVILLSLEMEKEVPLKWQKRAIKRSSCWFWPGSF